MTRVFDVGVAEFLPAVNPDSSANPNANSPYAKWFADRFMDETGATAYLQVLLGGVLPTTSSAACYRDAFSTALKGAGSTTGDRAKTRLLQLKQLEETVASGGHVPNADQEQAVQRILYDARGTVAIIEGEYRSSWSGDALLQLDTELRGLATRYSDTNSSVPFLVYAASVLGLK